MKNQIKYTEDILFNNYMVSADGEEFVHSQIPFFIEDEVYQNMKKYAEDINVICLNILHNINGCHRQILNYFDDFPLKKRIFNLQCNIAPMFWCRYDTFIDKNNNALFSEFNYDKPCGQKEIHAAQKTEFNGNVNKNFIEKLKTQLLLIKSEYFSNRNMINVSFLMDPCHREEFSHSFYFKHIFNETGINIIQTGPNNLSVKDGFVYAFSKHKIDIILRLFPTEFLYEVKNIEKILDSFDNGKVLIINDPRIVAIQAKGFFAYLFDLIKENSNLLNINEKNIIKKCLPYTEILTDKNKDIALADKDNFVVKSSLGRYSEEVYIGKMYKKSEWVSTLNDIFECRKIHVLQKFIDMRQDYVYSPYFNNTNIGEDSYGNFGVYIIDKDVCGLLVRWSSNYLTNDEYTFMCALGHDDFPLKIEKCILNEEDRNEFYDYLNEELSFKYNFTGSYTNMEEYISLDRIILERDIYEEIKNTSVMFCSILKKVYKNIQHNIKLFGPLLKIPKSLYKMVLNSNISTLCAVGRIDFAIDIFGNLKILEFNSETPAGLVESIGISSIIEEKMDLNYTDPDINLRENIKNNLYSIIKNIEKTKKVENIAVLTTWYYEDIYNTQIISQILNEFSEYNIIFGNIYDIKIRNNKFYIYGKRIDAIYRYYPLDFFEDDKRMRKFIKKLTKEEYMINPAHTIIMQSKGFFAVLYEMLGKNILSDEEENFIKKYIPYTALEKNKNLSDDFILKPYLSREGIGIKNGYEYEDNKDYSDYIFQDRVSIRPVKVRTYSTIKSKEENLIPIIGAYITGDRFAGIYTRAGSAVTDDTAVFIPTFVR